MMRTIAVCLLAVFVLVGCQDKVKPPVSAIDEGEIPSQESWYSNIVFSDSGVVRATVSADRIRVYDGRRETLMDSNVVVDFYDRNGVHSSVLRADRGRVDDATKDLEAFDNIVFKSDSGTVVTTDYLYWDSRRKKVRSDKFVTITSPTERLQGYGFEADQSLKNYVIRRISGEVELQEE